MHFENKSAIAYLYEIETRNVRIQLSKKLQKSNDFNKKINYRYNWIHAYVNLSGRPTQIGNTGYLRDSWQKMKISIQKEYEGKTMEKYIKEINESFESKENISKVMSQYFYFGLLFPNIPASHQSIWENKRMIEISEYEKETFEETLVYKHTRDDGLRYYEIELSNSSENNFVIEKNEGRILLPTNALLPESAEIDLTYRAENIISEWNFTLNKIG